MIFNDILSLFFEIILSRFVISLKIFLVVKNIPLVNYKISTCFYSWITTEAFVITFFF